MLEPNGPLSPQIYWRRRAFAIGAAVLALVVVVWLAVSAGGGGDADGEADAAASATSTTGTETATTEPTGESSTESGESSSSSTTAPATATSTTADPADYEQCPDQALALKVTPEQPSFAVGSEPVFGIMVTNISSEACTRDTGSGLQQAAVHTIDGERRLWSSADCYPDGEPDVRVLQPGDQAAFRVTWSGTTSQPECAGERLPVPAGAYAVTVHLGDIRSAPEPFNLV